MAMTSADKNRDRCEISECRNLGPVCQQDLNAAGIRTLGELKRIGPQQAFIRLLIERQRQGRASKCCNAAYLYALYGAIHDIDWRAIPQDKKDEFKAFTAELRESGQFR